jgi:hypothetical protein
MTASMKIFRTLALLGLVTLSACGPRPDPAVPPPQGTVNSDSTLTESTSDTPPGRAETQSPTTGTNNGRPDAPKDLRPGTDGSATPPPR